MISLPLSYVIGFILFFMKQQKKTGTPPAVLAVRKSVGTLDKVSELIESGKSYASVLQQIDAAIGLAQSAKKVLMDQHLEQIVKQSKNQKRLVTDLQKLYTFTSR